MTPPRMTTTAGAILEAVAPDRLLTLNQRDHWATRARSVKHWRYWASIVGRTGFKQPPSTVTVELPVRDNRRRDPHNYIATVKPIIDGLVDSGLWPDDTPQWVTVAEPRLIVRRDRLVRIVITPRPDTPKENQ